MIPFIFIGLLSILLYLFTLSNTIYGGDAGDLVSAILTKGFAHPPGYPLYTIIGRFFLYLPFNFLTTAGKITLISLISTVLSLIITYLILKILFAKNFNGSIALATISILFVNYLIWLYAIVPEVFPLNTLITLGILYSGLKYKNTDKLIWLAFSLFLTGLGICHHHTFILILPSLFILIYKDFKKIFASFKKVAFLLLSFIIGLLPLIYLPIVSQTNPEISWAGADKLAELISLLTRQVYGSFVPGQFISNLPIQRFIQLVNLNFFIFYDFTLVGYLSIIAGLIILLKSKIVKKTEKIAIFSALFLFGPFFVFYANFPLRDKFLLATVERFMIIFYFLLSVPLYLGLNWLFKKILKVFKIILGNKYKTIIPIIITLFFIFPIALGVKNYQKLVNLKKYSIAEKLGKDILNNADKKSLILLYIDTPLFNTQYVYFNNKNNYPDKIVLHAAKLPFDYYQKAIKLHYPKINFEKNKSYNLGDFILDNTKNYNIYSTDKYDLPSSFPYKWIVQGLLFKVVPKDYNDISEAEKTIETFWNSAENKNLADFYLTNSSYWLNYFPNDILRVYATGYQNTAYYYLSINKPDLALSHIKQALILNPTDTDSLYLQSIYYEEIGNCPQAEESIMKALSATQFKDNLYFNQLEKVVGCYKDQIDINRLKAIINKIKKSNSTLLKKI